LAFLSVLALALSSTLSLHFSLPRCSMPLITRIFRLLRVHRRAVQRMSQFIRRCACRCLPLQGLAYWHFLGRWRWRCCWHWCWVRLWCFERLKDLGRSYQQKNIAAFALGLCCVVVWGVLGGLMPLRSLGLPAAIGVAVPPDRPALTATTLTPALPVANPVPISELVSEPEPKTAEAWELRGYEALAQRRYAAAIADFEQAIAQGTAAIKVNSPDRPVDRPVDHQDNQADRPSVHLLVLASSYKGLAQIYLTLGQLETAQAHLTQGWQYLAPALQVSLPDDPRDLAPERTPDLAIQPFVGQSLADQLPPHLLIAQFWNLQAKLQAEQGQLEAAIATWEMARSVYAALNDAIGQLGTQLDQVMAYQQLGFYYRVRQLLEQTEQQWQQVHDPLLRGIGLRHLAFVEQVNGNFTTAEQLLRESLALFSMGEVSDPVTDSADITDPVIDDITDAVTDSTIHTSTDLKYQQQQVVTLYALGELAQRQRDWTTAQAWYQRAASTSFLTADRLRAELSLLAIVIDSQVENTLNQGDSLEQIASEFSRLYAQILTQPPEVQRSTLLYFTTQWLKWQSQTTIEPGGSGQGAIAPLDLVQRLLQVQQWAIAAGDGRQEALSWAAIAQIYQTQGQLEEAEQLWRAAIHRSELSNTSDLVAQQHAQLARLLLQRNDPTAALTEYRQAVQGFNRLRHDIVIADPSLQVSFRQDIEPIYREFIGLLLRPDANQTRLREARDALEALKIVELDNYFRESCLDRLPVPVDNLDPTAAIIYPIILPDRLEVVTSLPDREMSHHWIARPETEVLATIAQARSAFSRSRGSQERVPELQTLYNWLVRPLQSRLTQDQIQTLVFVLDAPLRRLPMAALLDGDQYLVERYNVANAPGLQLLANPERSTDPSVFLGGLSLGVEQFEPLPGVEAEATAIAQQVPTETWLNQRFTQKVVREALQYSRHPILHFATHGVFSSRPEETFLLTWDGRVNIRDFRNELQNRDSHLPLIDLLVLSACQTAKDDELTNLGLAGFAVKSGARSTIATLWKVNDQATAAFMTSLYAGLAQALPPTHERTQAIVYPSHPTQISKAAALRQAQIKFIHSQTPYAAPYYWAGFVLIGNWQ